MIVLIATLATVVYLLGFGVTHTLLVRKGKHPYECEHPGYFFANVVWPLAAIVWLGTTIPNLKLPRLSRKQLAPARVVEVERDEHA